MGLHLHIPVVLFLIVIALYHLLEYLYKSKNLLRYIAKIEIISNQGIYGRLACCYLGILLLDCIYCVNELCLFHPQNLTLNG